MKRLISTILIMTISASLVACSSADDSKDTTKATKEETEISETEKVTETSSEETTVETTTEETTTSAEETTKAGSVNPDDFWETDASGRRIFHQDEYLVALGYTMMGYNAIYFFDNNSGSITYEGGGDFFTYTSPGEFPETFVGRHVSDGEEVVLEFCGLETEVHKSTADNFINAAEAFIHYRETQEVPNGYE